MKKRCYIAGKIGDAIPSVYLPKFEQAKKEVSDMGFEPVCPTDLPHAHDKTWTAYMREDIIEMLKCDAVYALRDWRHSPGAKIEIRIAIDCGLNVIHQAMLVKKAQPDEVVY